MECGRCKTSLSVQDLDKNEWNDDSEIFIFKCPICEYETNLVSPLFESEHISNQYLRMIVSDSNNYKKEKHTDYIPELQRRKIFDHLSSCSFCSDKIEGLRLTEISREIEFNENTYRFFLKKAKNVEKQLVEDKSFIFENIKYEIIEEDLFYKDEERYCYNLEKDEFSVGMVSVIKIDDKLFLEKIWLKSEKRLEKEKQFLLRLRSGKVRILLDLIQKRHPFV